MNFSVGHTLRKSRALPRRYSSGCETVRRTRLMDGIDKYNVIRRYRSASRISRCKPDCAECFVSMTSPESPSLTTGNPNDKLRSTRSHSLKVSSMHPSILHHRSKRTFSLPCSSRPILSPFGIPLEHGRIERDYVMEEVPPKPYIPFEDTMAWYTPVAGLSCSLALFLWSCLLSYYWRT